MDEDAKTLMKITAFITGLLVIGFMIGVYVASSFCKEGLAGG